MGTAVNLNFLHNMNELITFFGQWPKLTLSVIGPLVAALVGFCWYFSGYSISRTSNLGTKTRTFWHWILLTVASLGGFIFGSVLIIIATMKATGGDIVQFFYQMAGLILIVVVVTFICNKVESTILGALTK